MGRMRFKKVKRVFTLDPLSLLVHQPKPAVNLSQLAQNKAKKQPKADAPGNSEAPPSKRVRMSDPPPPTSSLGDWETDFDKESKKSRAEAKTMETLKARSEAKRKRLAEEREARSRAGLERKAGEDLRAFEERVEVETRVALARQAAAERNKARKLRRQERDERIEATMPTHELEQHQKLKFKRKGFKGARDDEDDAPHRRTARGITQPAEAPPTLNVKEDRSRFGKLGFKTA